MLAEHACDVALVVARLEALTLVGLLLTASDADDELREPSVVDEEAEGHDGVAGLLLCFLELAYFLAVQEELAVAPALVVVV